MEQWLSLAFCDGDPFDPHNEDFVRLTSFFLTNLNKQNICFQSAQILKDLHRTFPTVGYFSKGSQGYFALQMILKMFSCYDRDECGYVQGMNFMAGMMAYHASPSIAFALFVRILETYQVRENYIPGLTGMIEKCGRINQLVEEKLPETAEFMLQMGETVQVEMHSMELVMGLFGSMIPFDDLVSFYDEFIKEGWDYFYKLILGFYEEIEGEVLALPDVFGIIELIKSFSCHSSSEN